MPDLAYGIGAYSRDYGNLPPLTLVNMYVEPARTSHGQVCLQSRPGLIDIATNGAGPIKAIFSNRGTLSGDDFSVSGSTLYRGTISKGAMASLGSGPISFAGADSELLIAGGGKLYSYNGTNLQAVAFPDSANVTAVTFIGSLFVAVRAGGAKFYWSDPLDGRTWDALGFATAEREPDKLLDIAALNDKIILYGQSTVEVWSHTGAADLPFSRIEGIGSQRKGIKDTGCWTEADNTVFHIGSDSVVYRFGETFDRVSDHWLEAKITASASASMFGFQLSGHEFVCVRLDDSTFAFDCATREWCEFQTNGGQWIARCAAMKDTAVYLGHDANGTIMGLSGWDDLGTEMTREFTAAVELTEPQSIDNLFLWANTGQSDVLSGQGSDPKVEMATSNDAGNTWTDYDDQSLGNAALGGTGQYRTIPEWRRLGMFDFPGMMARFRCSDPVPFRVSAVKVNETIGGRSR